jgi:hypothetical protein
MSNPSASVKTENEEVTDQDELQLVNKYSTSETKDCDFVGTR